jgi:hypothetical protein
MYSEYLIRLYYMSSVLPYENVARAASPSLAIVRKRRNPQICNVLVPWPHGALSNHQQTAMLARAQGPQDKLSAPSSHVALLNVVVENRIISTRGQRVLFMYPPQEPFLVP